MKIIYLTPATTKPSGGVKRIFRHVKFLVENGYDAYVGLPSAVSIDWFKHDVPIIHADVFNANPGDIFAVPDGFVHVLEALQDQPVRRVVLVLGFISPFYRLPVGRDYESYNVDAVMTNNKTISDFIYFSKLWPSSRPISVVETSIDRKLFYYDDKAKKKLVACYNKHHDEQLVMLSKIMRLRGHTDWEFVELADMNIDKYADILRQASIFLCHLFCEGLPVPILEAMACGCLCVGSHGSGGSSFVVNTSVMSMKHGRSVKNFITAKPGDLFDFAKKLNMAMDIIDADREPEITNMRQNAIATAAQFGEIDEKESILSFWKGFLDG